MDINNTAGVQALLQSLQTSQAWRDVSTKKESGSNDPPTGPSSVVESTAPSSSNSAATVASLLAQLHTAPTWSLPSNNTNLNFSYSEQLKPVSWSQSVPASVSEDRRGYSYKQALPALAELAQNPEFIKKIVQLKKDQDTLEHTLWDQRLGVKRKYEDKVTASKTRAAIIGAEMTKHEVDMLSDAYRKELERFDREKVLPLWDNLVSQQQDQLAEAGVPTMFATTTPDDRERQQRIIKVVEDLMS